MKSFAVGNFFLVSILISTGLASIKPKQSEAIERKICVQFSDTTYHLQDGKIDSCNIHLNEMAIFIE